MLFDDDTGTLVSSVSFSSLMFGLKTPNGATAEDFFMALNKIF